MDCPFIDHKDKEDEDDAEDSEIQFDEIQEEDEAKKEVPVPKARPTEAALDQAQEEMVTSNVPGITQVVEAFLTAGTEPVPALPQRAPAITPFVKPEVKPQQEVPSKFPTPVGEFRGAEALSEQRVAASVNISQAYQLELEETGWRSYQEELGAVNRNIVSAQSSSAKTLLNPFVTALVTAAAAEILYTQYVKGSDKMKPSDSSKSGRRKGLGKTNRGESVKDPRKGPGPGKARESVSQREGKATSRDADRAIRKAKSGARGSIRSIGAAGGRGGWHKMVDTFRPKVRKKLSKREKAKAGRRKTSSGGK